MKMVYPRAVNGQNLTHDLELDKSDFIFGRFISNYNSVYFNRSSYQTNFYSFLFSKIAFIHIELPLLIIIYCFLCLNFMQLPRISPIFVFLNIRIPA